jgi:Beta-glucan synthesis-associated protein SKN1/KRE6/Sbg1
MKNCKNLPSKMEIDYIRLYQDKDDPSHTVDCSPERFPTAEFIAAHAGSLLSTPFMYYNNQRILTEVLDFHIYADRYKNWEPYTGPIPVGMSPLLFYTFSVAVSCVSMLNYSVNALCRDI